MADATTVANEADALAGALTRTGLGDRAAFRALYDRTSAKLLGVCLRICIDRQEAEEALQEAYVSIWRRAAGYDPARGGAMAWLVTVARNAAVDRLRSRRRIATEPLVLAEAIADAAPSADLLLEGDEDRRRLGRCLATLDAGDADLIRTAFLQGSTYSEIASRAARPIGTIKSRIRRALLKLRECLA